MTEEIDIENAGLVLLAPLICQLFDRTGFMFKGTFNDQESAQKAVYLLQHAVDGQTSAREHCLLLPKLLCAVPQDFPLQGPEQIEDAHADIVEQLLQSVCANWAGLENTTTRGLQETFLQRKGRLHLAGDTWSLFVEQGPSDMLLDRAPWSFRAIRLSWMNHPVQVSWR